MEPPGPEGTFEEKVSYLCGMTRRTAKNCPILPVPFPQPLPGAQLEADEISLSGPISIRTQGADSPGPIRSEDGLDMELEFDGQAE